MSFIWPFSILNYITLVFGYHINHFVQLNKLDKNVCVIAKTGLQ